MTVGEYRKQLEDQLDQLKEFTNDTEVQFNDQSYCWHSSELLKINIDKMSYDESHSNAKYRAVHKDGSYASWGSNRILESDSIEKLSSSIAFYYHRSSFDLRVQDKPGAKWRKPTAFEEKLFDKELDGAFRLDEWH